MYIEERLTLVERKLEELADTMTKTQTKEDWETVQGAATRLKCSSNTIRNGIENGTIRYNRIGGSNKITIPMSQFCGSYSKKKIILSSNNDDSDLKNEIFDS